MRLCINSVISPFRCRNRWAEMLALAVPLSPYGFCIQMLEHFFFLSFYINFRSSFCFFFCLLEIYFWFFNVFQFIQFSLNKEKKLRICSDINFCLLLWFMRSIFMNFFYFFLLKGYQSIFILWHITKLFFLWSIFGP